MLRSRAVVLGAEANKKAESGQYYKAIELFSKAIELYPIDYRFYLNRAFCYEKTELYHLGLADCEDAIRLNNKIEKCVFRKARALVGLKEYNKAEETYKLVLEMNPNCTETREDLIRLRCIALTDMGFDKQSAISASTAYLSIRAAIDGLLSERVVTTDVKDDTNNNNDLNPGFMALNLNDDKLYNPFNEYIVCNENTSGLNRNGVDFDTVIRNGLRYADKARNWAQLAETQPTLTTATKLVPEPELKSGDKLLKPTNIWNYNGLRIENINPENKKSITKRFGTFGKIKSIETLKNSKSSVWIFYDNPLAPIEAIARYQSTIHLELNYYHKGQTTPLRIYFAPTNDQTELKFCRPKQPLDNKGECYYWRTTNCSLEDRCPLLHIPINKHIDAQVWMKTRDGKPV